MKQCNCNKCSHRENYNNMPKYTSSCKKDSNVFPTNYLYGYAYTPNMQMQNTFTPEVGLQNGSIFPELVSPYKPGDSIDFINYLKNNNRNGGCGCGR